MKESIRQKTEELCKRIGRENIWVILGFTLLVALRCISFGKVPGGFNQDGALAAVDALALSEYGTDHFGTWLPAHLEAWGYGQMSALLSYLMVPFIKLFGLNAITARLPVLLFSLAGAAAAYGLALRLFSKRTAIAVLFFLAVNPWHYMQSRWALDCNLFPHMFIIGLYFLVAGMEKARYIYVSMFFFALCMYSYGVAFYMVPFFLLAACVLLLKAGRIHIKQALGAAAVYFFFAWPIYGTMLINFMKWDTVKLPFVTMQFFSGSVRSADILFFSDNPLSQLFQNISQLFKVVFLQKPDLPWNAIDNFGTMYLWSMPFVLLGVFEVFRQAVKSGDVKTRTGMRILAAYWICSIFSGVCINSVNVNRINIIFYGNILFAGAGIAFIINKVRWTLACFLLFYGVGSTMFFHTYFTTWAEQIGSYFYADFLEALDYAQEYRCDYYYLTPDTQYTGTGYVSEVLTLFGMEIDAKYYCGETDAFSGRDISYRDRYRYQNPEDEAITAEAFTGYVLRMEHRYRFSEEAFFIKDFGNYFVAIPLHYVD